MITARWSSAIRKADRRTAKTNSSESDRRRSGTWRDSRHVCSSEQRAPYNASRVCEAIGIDCQPIINVVQIEAATATIEGQMVGGMLGEAPVADEICRQSIIARVGADRQDGNRCRGE